MHISRSQENSNSWLPALQTPFVQFTGVLFCIGLGLLTGAITLWPSTPLTALAVSLGVGLTVLIITKVEYGFVALVFITHSNLSSVLIENHGAPSIAKILTLLIVVGIIARYSLQRTRPTGWLEITLLIALYAIAGLGSILFEPYVDEGVNTLISLAKNSIVALFAVFLIKQYSDIRNVIWALVASGALLGTVALIQYVSGTFENTYWGLSMAPSHHIISDIDDFRLSGSFGDPNFFAMFQSILLPLALERMISERKTILRMLAAYSFAVILFTVIFSYSRGGFLGIMLMLFVFVYFYRHKAWQVLSLIIIGMTILSFSPKSNYVERMLTLEYLIPDKKSQKVSERSFQGRKSEMIVATLIFLDNPIMGVGIGNYEQYYQEYAKKVYIDFRKEQREAHCRYLEILAETGLIGFAAFCLLLWRAYYSLFEARRITIESGNIMMERISVAVMISLTGFLSGYIFLHDAWPRLSWLLFGIVFAIANVARGEEKE